MNLICKGYNEKYKKVYLHIKFVFIERTYESYKVSKTFY